MTMCSLDAARGHEATWAFAACREDLEGYAAAVYAAADNGPAMSATEAARDDGDR